MALAASPCGGSSAGTTRGGGAAKAKASSPAGMRHAVTPAFTAATSRSAPSGVATAVVTESGKPRTQRG